MENSPSKNFITLSPPCLFEWKALKDLFSQCEDLKMWFWGLGHNLYGFWSFQFRDFCLCLNDDDDDEKEDKVEEGGGLTDDKEEEDTSLLFHFFSF